MIKTVASWSLVCYQLTQTPNISKIHQGVLIECPDHKNKRGKNNLEKRVLEEISGARNTLANGPVDTYLELETNYCPLVAYVAIVRLY